MGEGWEMVSLAIGVVLAVLLLAVGHWFPWQLSLIGRYVYGTVALWIGLATWRLLNGDWQSPAGFVAIAVAGGLTVVAAYRIDGWVKRIRQAERAEAGDDELAG